MRKKAFVWGLLIILSVMLSGVAGVHTANAGAVDATTAIKKQAITNLSATSGLVMNAVGLSGGRTGLAYYNEDSPSTYHDYYKVVDASGNTAFTTDLSALMGARANNIHLTSVYGLAGGKSVVTWEGTTNGCDGNTNAMFQFVMLDASGNVVKNATDISTVTSRYNCYTGAAELSNGHIAFFWQHAGDEFYLRIFDSLGNPVTPPTSITKTGSRESLSSYAEDYSHSMAANNGGTFMVVYHTNNSSNYYGVLYNNNGTQKTVNGFQHFKISDSAKPPAPDIRVTALSNNNYAVLYKTDSGNRVKIFDNNGSAVGSETTSGLSYGDNKVNIVGLTGGGFIVTDTSGNKVYAKEYRNDGTLEQDWTLVDSDAVSGTFHFVFNGYDKGFGIYNDKTGNIVIHGTNATPTATGGTLSVTEDQAASGTLTGSDPDGNPLTYSVVTPPAKGIVNMTNAATGAYTYTPNLNATGSDSFTFKVNDGLADSNVATVNVTINPVNDLPTISNIADVPIDEDSATAALAFTVGDVETTAGSLTVTGSSSNKPLVPDANIIFGGSGANRTVKVTPAANQSGTATITITVSDGTATANAAFQLTVNAVNDAPTASSGSLSVTEDQPANGTLAGVDAEGGALTYSIVNQPAKGTVNLNTATGAYIYTPNANASGSDTFTFKVSDGESDSSVATVSVTIAEVNDTPTISDIVDVAINEDSATAALAFTVGDVETTAGSLTLTSSSSNKSLVPDANIVFGGNGANRTVKVTPAANQSGTTTITITVSDGTATATDTFVVTVDSVEDKPTANDGSLTVTEDQAANGVLGGSDSDGDALTFSVVTQPGQGTVTITNAATGAYTYTPNPNATGSDSFTFKVNDNVADSNAATVNVTINPINDTPTITAITDQTVNEDIATSPLTFTVGDVETAAGSLTLTGSSGNTVLVPDANIVFGGSGANRTVTVTPAANQSGTATITITVSDGAAAANATFQFTVNPVNDAPEASGGNLAVTEDQAANGMLAGVDAEGSTLIYDIVGQPTKGTVSLNSATGAYTYTPNADASGSDTFTFKVSDGTLDSSAATVSVTIAEVNDVPAISDIADAITNEDTATAVLNFTVGDVEMAAVSLTVTGSSSDTTLIPNANIVFGGSEGNRTVTVIPAENRFGTATITITVSDRSAVVTDTFVVTVNSVEDLPTAADGSLTVTEDQPAIGVLGGSDGDGDVLTFSVMTPPGQGTVTITNTATGAYTYTPNPDATGSDSFTFMVSAGSADSNTATISVTITGENDMPTITAIAEQTVYEDTAIPPLAFTVGDVETAAESLTVTGSSSNKPLVPDANIVFGGSGADRTVTIMPALNQFGTATITITVSDGAATSSFAFQLTVNAVNDAPAASSGSLAVTEDQPANGTLAGVDAEGSTLTYDIVDQPVKGTLNLNTATGAYTYTPNANASGSDTFKFKVSDGAIASNVATVSVTIAEVNDSPSISDIADVAINEDSATAALAFTVGDIETAAGSLTVTGSSSNTTLVPDTNIVFGGSGANRTVKVMPAANQSGTATITITVSDGTVTVTDTFVVTVNSVEDTPTAIDGSLIVTEDESANGVLGGKDSDSDALTFSIVTQPGQGTVTITNATTGAYTYTPNPNATGSDSFTFKVRDNVADSNEATVNVTINPINDTPTITAITDQTVDEDIATFPLTFTVGDVETAAGSLTLTGSSGNMVLVPDANIVFGGSGANRTVTITPAANQSGTATITIIVSDGAAAANAPFQLTVIAVNDAPEASNGSLVATEDQAANGTLTGVDAEGSALTYSIADQPAKGTVNLDAATGAYTYTPNADASGSDTFTFKVSDGTLDSNVATVSVTIAEVNDAPSVSDIADAMTNEDTATAALDFTVGDVETTVGSLTVMGSSNNKSLVPDANIVFGGSGADRTVTVTPALNQFGTAIITVTVDDGTTTVSDTFELTVSEVNDAPTVSDIVNQAIQQDGAATPLHFTVGDAETAAGSLTVTGSSSNTTLVPKANIVFGGSGANRTVTVTPAANQSGTATITVTVDDGAKTSSDSFVLTVSPYVPPAGNPGGLYNDTGKPKETDETKTTKPTDEEKKVAEVSLDDQKMNGLLQDAKQGAVITIPATQASDQVVWTLQGTTVQAIGQKEAVLELKTTLASYSLSANQLHMDDILSELGENASLENINIQVSIAKPSEEDVKLVRNRMQEGNITLVVPPVEFTITASYGNRTVEIDTFDAYVERTIAIPDGVDPNRITTAAVVMPDGSFRHVPTKIIVKDGKYYAVVNSLTNSLYALVYNEKQFDDVGENHWAQSYVNDMASRLIISGVDDRHFSPDRPITRAEFAVIVVKALGLRYSGQGEAFSDVQQSDWFWKDLSAGHEYGLIDGYKDGTFGPDRTITREEAMVILERALELAGLDRKLTQENIGEALGAFKDRDSFSEWSKSAAALCVRLGIVVGSNGHVNPERNITRAETAAMIMRMLQKSELI